MNVFILDQTPDLAVDHPVELGDQDNVIAIMSVQCKKRQPFITSGLAPIPGIEHQLTLINDQEQRTLFYFFALEMFLGELNQKVRGNLKVTLVTEQLTLFLRDTVLVNREVAHSRTTSTEQMIQPFCYMQALP